MRALLAGELRRALARGLVRLVFAVMALGIVAAGTITFFATHAISEAAYQARVHSFQAQAAAAQANGQQICNIGPDGPPATNDPPGCLPVAPVRDRRFHLHGFKDAFDLVSAPLAILAVIIGATLIAAEWPSRTITTILTWEPRRVRVLSAKALAAVVVSVASALASIVVLGLVLIPSAIAHAGPTADSTAALWRSVAGVALRSLGLTAISAVFGFSIASIGRNTAAALGVLFAYVVAIERIVAVFVNSMQRWLILGNASAFVSNNRNDAARGQSPGIAGIYLATVALALFAAAAVIFRRRDVA